MWQVSGRSDITDFEEVVRLDKEYQRAKWGKLASTYIMLGEKCAVKFADEIIVLSEGVRSFKGFLCEQAGLCCHPGKLPPGA